jgi:hypothetical protein
MSDFYYIGQNERSQDDAGDNYHGKEVGKERLSFAHNFIFFDNIFQEHGNGNGFENDGFEKYENQVKGIDLDQFDKRHAKKNNSLQSQNIDIGRKPVSYTHIYQADGKSNKQNIDHIIIGFNLKTFFDNQEHGQEYH